MARSRTTRWAVFIGLYLTYHAACNAEVLLVAVASNFKPTAQLLAQEFKRTSAIDLKLSSASTGVLYAQIRQGAPFDVFLAADTQHVQALQEAKLDMPDTRFSYAVGELVLLVDRKYVVANDLGRTLKSLRQTQQRIAIANPASAPYGRAAREAMQKLGLWQEQDRNLIRASNIAQSLQYVAAGTVSAAFTARSLLRYANLDDELAVITVPQSLHAPIIQQAIVLRNAPHSNQATGFVKFLASNAARKLIKDSGYLLPEIQTR